MPHESTLQTASEVAQEILRAIDQLRQGSGYGPVKITVNEGRVTQIEHREKVRFSHATGNEPHRIKPTVNTAAII